MYLETQQQITYSPSITSDVTGRIRGYITDVVYKYSRGEFQGVQFGYEYADESGQAILVDADFIDVELMNTLAVSVSEFIPSGLSESDTQTMKFNLGFMSVMAASFSITTDEINLVS